MDQVAALFEADDPLLAECGAKVAARAGRLMLEACRAAKKEVPAEVGASLTSCAGAALPRGVGKECTAAQSALRDLELISC